MKMKEKILDGFSSLENVEIYRVLSRQHPELPLPEINTSSTQYLILEEVRAQDASHTAQEDEETFDFAPLSNDDNDLLHLLPLDLYLYYLFLSPEERIVFASESTAFADLFVNGLSHLLILRTRGEAWPLREHRELLSKLGNGYAFWMAWLMHDHKFSLQSYLRVLGAETFQYLKEYCLLKNQELAIERSMQHFDFPKTTLHSDFSQALKNLFEVYKQEKNEPFNAFVAIIFLCLPSLAMPPRQHVLNAIEYLIKNNIPITLCYDIVLCACHMDENEFDPKIADETIAGFKKLIQQYGENRYVSNLMENPEQYVTTRYSKILPALISVMGLQAYWFIAKLLKNFSGMIPEVRLEPVETHSPEYIIFLKHIFKKYIKTAINDEEVDILWNLLLVKTSFQHDENIQRALDYILLKNMPFKECVDYVSMAYLAIPLSIDLNIFYETILEAKVRLGEFEVNYNLLITYRSAIKDFVKIMGVDTLPFLVLLNAQEPERKHIMNLYSHWSPEVIVNLKILFDKNRKRIMVDNDAMLFYNVLRTRVSADFNIKIFSKMLDHMIANNKPLEAYFDYVTFSRLYERSDQPGNTSHINISFSFLDKYFEFMAHFKHVNGKVQNREQHGRDFNQMIVAHQSQLNYLIDIARDNIFQILSRYLVTSTLALERLLEKVNLSALSAPNLELVFAKHSHEIINEKMHETFFSLATFYDLGVQLDSEEIGPNLFLEKEISLKEVHDEVAKQVILLFLKKMGIDEKAIDSQLIIESFPIYMLKNLLLARKAMEGGFYQEVFDRFVIHDLTGVKFESHEELVEHNLNIRTALEKEKINIDKAFAYQQKTHFEIGGTLGTIDVHQLVLALWEDLNRLHSCLPENNKKRLQIDEFQKSMLKGFVRHVQLTATQANEIFSKIKNASSPEKTRLDTLVKQLEAPQFSENTALEFFGHLKREVNMLNPLLKESNTNNQTLSKKRQFRIEAWDKNSPLTFNLGAEVGCCLAPDGGHFPAMVQRRMDDAMFMHVVIDEVTQKPISLAWLYFGKAKPPEEGIYVVANFFEIAASCAKDQKLRDHIVAHLQEYIGQYTKEIGAKGFMMNPLSYGLIPDFKGFASKKIQFEKLGGYLSFNSETDPYYLSSLNVSSFYEFCSRKAEHVASASTQAPLLQNPAHTNNHVKEIGFPLNNPVQSAYDKSNTFF